MIDDEKVTCEEYSSFMGKILKSLLYTFAICIFSIWGIFMLINLLFGNMSGEQSDTWIIISFCISIIFTIFYCTFTIVEEIRKKEMRGHYKKRTKT